MNAAYDEVFYTSFEDITGNYELYAKTGEKSYSGNYSFDIPNTGAPFILTYWKLSQDSIWEFEQVDITTGGGSYTISNNIIDEVRLYPKDALMSTSTYIQGIGLTSATDINDISGYTEYDAFGRLIKVYDQDRNLIRENLYHTASEYGFEISTSTDGSGLFGCEIDLEPKCYIDGVNDCESFSFQWYKDADRDTLISTGKVLTVSPSLGESTYYLTTYSEYLPYQQLDTSITIIPGTITANPPDTVHFTHDGGTYDLGFDYQACDNGWDATISDDGNWNDYGWLTITKDYENDSINLQCDAAIDSETQIMQVNLLNSSGETDHSFVVKRTGVLDFDLNYTVTQAGDFKRITVTPTVQGGLEPFTYSWEKNGVQQFGTDSTFSFFLPWFITSATVSCTISDSCDPAQSVTKNISITI